MANRILAGGILLAVTGCAAPLPTGGSFQWRMPEVGSLPTRPGFTYVKFNVVGVAEMVVIQKSMYKDKRIGLVNSALESLYAQVPMDGNTYGLVNVITDYTMTKYYQVVTENRSTRETFLKEEPKTLVIRADVVSYTKISTENLPVGSLFELTDEGKAALHAHVLRELAGRTTL